MDDITGDDDVRRVTAAIHEAIKAGVSVAGRELYTAVSIGVRTSAESETKPGDMLRDADVAMYRAKRDDGARTMVFDGRLRVEVQERHRVQLVLHQALRRDELRLGVQSRA